MKSKDLLWKGIIEDCLELFLQYFFLDEFEQFDLTKPVEFLEQELKQLYPEGDARDRRLDKLIKIFLRDGTERWILIHIEVQGYEDSHFPRRVFEYAYRALDRFGIEICTLAIYTDGNKHFHPICYEWELLGTKLSYSFKTYKVLDQSEEELLASDNPFAMVVFTVLHALLKGKFAQNQLHNIKTSIARRLLELNYDKKFLNSLFWFMNNYLSFDNPAENRIFAKEFTKQYNLKEKNMGVIEIIREEMRREALEKATEKGIEIGMEKGMEKGMSLKTISGVIKADQKGVKHEDVAFFFDISVEEVKQILKEHKK